MYEVTFIQLFWGFFGKSFMPRGEHDSLIRNSNNIFLAIFCVVYQSRQCDGAKW